MDLKIARQLLIYLLLIGGSLVFIWPFLWMAATSAKLDRELFGDTMRLWPQRPIPRLQSPYIDDRLFDDLQGPHLEEAVALIEQDLAASNYPWPNDVDARDSATSDGARDLRATSERFAGRMFGNCRRTTAREDHAAESPRH